MAPPIESAAASTICLQWRWGEGEEERRGERRERGEREGCWKGRDRRSEGDQRGGWSVCLCESVGGARRGSEAGEGVRVRGRDGRRKREEVEGGGEGRSDMAGSEERGRERRRGEERRGWKRVRQIQGGGGRKRRREGNKKPRGGGRGGGGAGGGRKRRNKPRRVRGGEEKEEEMEEERGGCCSLLRAAGREQVSPSAVLLCETRAHTQMTRALENNLCFYSGCLVATRRRRNSTRIIETLSATITIQK